MNDLMKDNFSIGITKATIVNDEKVATGGWFSSITPASQYAMFTIETKSKLPMYDSVNKLHVV
tara:strand:+ start:1153 stop:1341 length:189 start_codon:yes stop_codon:yes gene_type:complete